MKKYLYIVFALFSVVFALPSHAAKVQSHYQREVNCMATAIFYEAQGEPHRGKVAVGNVIINRMRSGLYPKTACGVIRERGQFQWVHNHKLRKKRVYSAKRHQNIHNLANSLYREYKAGKRKDVTRGSLFFSSNGVRPAPRAVKSVKIGRHQFFTLRGFNKFKNYA